MLIYSYCSYDGSPCGFRIGRFDAEHPVLQDVPVQKTIQKAFDCGYVDFVCGTEPDKSSALPYVIIMKKLQLHQKRQNIYLNFALEMNRKEYLQTLPGILHQYEQVDAFAALLAGMIIPDRENMQFGLTLSSAGIRKFLTGIQSDGNPPEAWLIEPHKLFLFRKILPDTQNMNRSRELAEAFDFDKSVKVLHDAEKHCHIAQLFDINSELKAKGSELWNRIIRRKES